jgi:2-methylcitrate dehydratase PrpD
MREPLSAPQDAPLPAAPGLSRTLARFAAQTRFETLPAGAVATTKRCLLDGLGTMLAASTLGEGCDRFVELAREQGGHEQSTVFGHGCKVPALMAAFANGSMAHALDFEDAHDRSLTHPNAATIPAALAIAEAVTHARHANTNTSAKVSGKALITALAIGSELVCRLGGAVRVALDDYGWYPPPIFGAFGATAAAGHLLGLGEGAMLDAFSLALAQATCSAEIKHAPDSWLRAVRDAFAAKTGVLSAQLAHKGVRGSQAPFEGRAGLFALYARGHYDPGSITLGLGESYALEEISFKPWPTCRGTHAFIEAALALARLHAIDPARISAVRAVGHPIAMMLFQPVAQKRRPSTAIDAKFSIPFTVATALCHGGVALHHFAPEALADPQVLALAACVEFDVTTADRHRLEHATAGALEIETADGQRHRREVPVPQGHPSHPISDDALIAKFMDCCRHARSRLDPEAARRIVDRIFELDRLDDVAAQLCELL